MNKRAILRLVGSLEKGFEVILEIKQESGESVSEAEGRLPALPELAKALKGWAKSYEKCLEQARISGLTITRESSHQGLLNRCRLLGQQLEELFWLWLKFDDFHEIELHLRQSLNTAEIAQILIRSDNRIVHRLPWHTWKILDSYPHVEVIFGSPYQQIPQAISQSLKVRILAILGDSKGIDTKADQQELEKLPQAEVKFLIEPSRKELGDRLWDQPWDILFFAGHSDSVGQQGVLKINSTESLTIKELRYGLKKSIARGLQLAIFNSCKGLGIAYELEQLSIPQVIVMREPVPDAVAQIFLKHFLIRFSGKEPLHLALRYARERLQSSEDQFPNATWLPVLFQNPALPTATWENLKRPESWRDRLRFSLALGAGTTIAVMALRTLALLQPAELALFDHLTRMRPSEPEDEHILVVEVTRQDVDAQPPEELLGRSLSDQTLDKLLEKISAYEPRFIGLDLYRDMPAQLPSLKTRLAQTQNLIGVCKFPNREDPRVDSYAKPPELPDEQVGFSDLREDQDGVVRIQPLYASPVPGFPCPANYSFSARLAFEYLEAEGISLVKTSDDDLWQWGKAKIKRIGASQLFLPSTFSSYGSYANLNAQAHQIWLSYRANSSLGQHKNPIDAFNHISVRDVLGGKLNKKDIQNRIILIGTTSLSQQDVDDYWETPYRDNRGEQLKIPGVYLQAQMISQLIQAGLGERSLLRALPWLWDAGLILAGMILFILVTQGHGLKRICLLLLLALLGCYAGCWAAFIFGGLYLPLIPASLALLGSGVGMGVRRSQAAHPDRRFNTALNSAQSQGN